MLHVLRMCSVFEPPDEALRGYGRRFDPIGGMQSHTAQLTRELDGLGVRQTVITTRPPGAPSAALLGGARILRHGLPVPLARQAYAAFAAPVARRLAAGADLLHAHLGEDVAVLPIALAAARRAGIPLVVTVHTSVRHTYRPAGVRGRVLAVLGGAAEAVVLERADHVIALTPRLAGMLVRSGVAPQRVHVIPSGVTAAEGDVDGADPFPGIARPRVLFVGRLHRQKDVPALVRAFAALRTSAQLVLVGDGPERAAVRRELRRSGLERRAHLTGFIPHRRIRGAMRHADVLAVPSAYEELGSVALEAMSAGLPVVASRTGGLPHALGDAGALVPPGDANALAAAIDRLLMDGDAAARMAAAGRARAERFRWTDLARRMLSVYDRAVA